MLLNLYTSYLIIERVIVMKYFYANAKINHTLIENFTYEIGERGLVSRKKKHLLEFLDYFTVQLVLNCIKAIQI